MKRFLLRGTLLFILLVATLGVGEYLVRQVPNPYQYKHAWMTAHADEVETLILGSSHAYAALQPALLPHAFSLANSSQNLMYDYFMLEQYGDHCKQLKTILLPISYFTFFATPFEETEYWWRAINYAVYMQCDYHPLLSKYHWEIAHPSVYRGKLQTLVTKAPSRILCDSLGWSLHYNVADKANNWDDATATLAYHTKPHLDCRDTNLHYFRAIATWCHEHGVALILTTTPTWHTYHNHLNQKQLQEMYATINLLQKQYNLPYFDYMTDQRFVADDFYNADHLSNLGAAKFTQILWHDIQNHSI